jgi:hypothetical protein
MKSPTTSVCQYCQQSFHPNYRLKKDKPQAFCSRKCYLENRWGTSPIPKCEWCGKDATTTGKRKQKFCSFECRVAAQNGKKLPYLSNRLQFPCLWCAKIVDRPASNFHSVRGRVFCDSKCLAEWQSKFVRQESHPRWKGGNGGNSGISYGKGWGAAKRKTKTRSGGVCERCKKCPAVHVHHKLPVRFFDKIEDAHFLENLLHVCIPCHIIEHRLLEKRLPLLNLIPFKD